MSPVATAPLPPSAGPSLPPQTQQAGAAAAANQPDSTGASSEPLGAAPPAVTGSFSDLLDTARTAQADAAAGAPTSAPPPSVDGAGDNSTPARTAPAEGQTKKGQSLNTSVADSLSVSSLANVVLSAGSATASFPAHVAGPVSSSSSADRTSPVGAPGAAAAQSSPASSADDSAIGQMSSSLTGGSGDPAQAPILSSLAAAVSGAGAPGDHAQPTLTPAGSEHDAPAPRAAAGTAVAGAMSAPATADSPADASPAGTTSGASATPASATPASTPPAPQPAPASPQVGGGPQASGSSIQVDASADARTPAQPSSKTAKGDSHARAGSAGEGGDTPLALTDATHTTPSESARGVQAPTDAVPLHKAGETLIATVTAMSKQGLSQARIELSPNTLGGVKVVLTQTDNGLVARVITDRPEAAQTLQAAAEELKRNLESNGTTVVALNIGTSAQNGDQSGQSFQHGEQTPGSAQNPNTTASRAGDLGGDDDAETATPTTHLTVTLGDGSLVNVLA